MGTTASSKFNDEFASNPEAAVSYFEALSVDLIVVVFDQNILQFDVPVNDALRMQSQEPFVQLIQGVEFFARLQTPIFPREILLEIRVAQFHDDPRGLEFVIVAGDHVGVFPEPEEQFGLFAAVPSPDPVLFLRPGVDRTVVTLGPFEGAKTVGHFLVGSDFFNGRGLHAVITDVNRAEGALGQDLLRFGDGPVDGASPVQRAIKVFGLLQRD